MPRWFNTAGPNNPLDHFTVPVLERLPEVWRLLETRSWFGLHAPRQSGKTTSMAALADELTASGRYAALLATCEAGAAYATEPEQAVRAVIGDIVATAWHEAAGAPSAPSRPASDRSLGAFRLPECVVSRVPPASCAAARRGRCTAR